MHFFNFVAATIYATFTGRFHPILLELRLRSHSGSDSMFSRILFQFLSWRPHRRYLLTGEGLEGLCYEMRVGADHLFPAPRLHHVRHVTCVNKLNRLKLCPESFWFTETNNKHTALQSPVPELLAAPQSEGRPGWERHRHFQLWGHCTAPLHTSPEKMNYIDYCLS